MTYHNYIKIKFLIIFIGIFSFHVNAINITIIESRTSGKFWTVQDSVWNFIATGMGYNASIVPQSTLDNISNLNSTDILIVSSGTILFPSANRYQTIQQFVLSGRPAYIQSEYASTLQGNMTFASLMQSLGANFNWITTINGVLTPMNVIGTLATTPFNVPAINSYFYYGCAGTGTGVDKFLEYKGNYFGFYYSGCNAMVITISDEDWVWKGASPALMQNILYKFVNYISTSTTPNLGKDTTLCQGQTISLNGGSALSYLWSNGSTASSMIASTSGTYWVQTSNGQCISRDSILISLNQNPIPNLGKDTTLCDGQTITLNGGFATSYLWSNGSTIASIIASTSETYWVQVNIGHCSSSDTVSVLISNCEIVEIEIELPNVFSPNCDGTNDNFIPIKYKGISQANLIIYNRWGEKLFSTNDLGLGWNGSYKNCTCSDGTYFWIVQYTTITNESKELKGFITLIK